MASITVQGMPAVVKALKETPKETRKLLREVITREVRIVAQRTRQAAPLDTGALRQAIQESPPKGRSLTGAIVLAPGEFRGRVPSSYLFAVEYGAKGRPFVRSTAEAAGAGYVSRVTAMGKTLESVLAERGTGGRTL